MKKIRFRFKSCNGHFILAAFIFLAAMFYSSPSVALEDFSMFGIDSETMQVEDPYILKRIGMFDVKKGDEIAFEISIDGKYFFTNQRTEEKVGFSPVQYR
ncbi:MAG: hypothetical protein D5R98_05505 [Desulfonatronovibrio sp. MSAO_Bac4]|nr:MAG: hypothetical protein D5R98_05505 [Desulfonatronovibrio sp. MSAO_Bac4]